MIRVLEKTLLVCMLIVSIFGASQPVDAATQQRIAIPAYAYPCHNTANCFWDQLDASAPTVNFVVMDPASGPGVSKDANYVSQLQRTHAAGIRIIGYVNTAGGKRALSLVKADVLKYYQWYNVDGIFFDLASTSCTDKPYYQTLYNFVKARNATRNLVVLNPGWNTPECYVSVSNVIINFEGYYSTYVNWKPSGWEAKYPASHFWQIVHTTSINKLQDAITRSKVRHAGWVYVTNDVMPNPYDVFPGKTYWTNELNYVKQ